MKTTTKIESQIDDLDFYFMDGEEAFPFTENPEVDIAKALDCSAKLVDCLQCFVDNIKEIIGNDLKDIWERLDKIETQ